MTSTASAPHHSRVNVADVLRGLSVLGIILLHSIEHFNFYSFPDPTTQPGWLNFTDKAIWSSLFFLFGGKAYAIFAMLFGFSFFIQDDNQRLKGNDFRRRFCWRLLLLFVIGNINAMFFTAEILVMYSLIGFVLVLTCRWSTRSLVWIASLLMLQPVAIYNIIRAVADPGYVLPTLPTAELWNATFAVQSGGTFLETVAVNLREGQIASLAWAWDHGRIFQTASLFIFGMLIGREGWFLEKNHHYWGRVLVAALFLYFPLHGLIGLSEQFVTASNILIPLKLILTSLSNIAFMCILVSLVIFAYYRTSMKRTLEKIIPYGKMSMTNYVTQSIVGSMLYYNWGFGLQLGITASVCVGVILFLLQYSFCRWWLGVHSHGPLEYAWKRATWVGSGR